MIENKKEKKKTLLLFVKLGEKENSLCIQSLFYLFILFLNLLKSRQKRNYKISLSFPIKIMAPTFFYRSSFHFFFIKQLNLIFFPPKIHLKCFFLLINPSTCLRNGLLF